MVESLQLKSTFTEQHHFVEHATLMYICKNTYHLIKTAYLVNRYYLIVCKSKATRLPVDFCIILSKNVGLIHVCCFRFIAAKQT